LGSITGTALKAVCFASVKLRSTVDDPGPVNSSTTITAVEKKAEQGLRPIGYVKIRNLRLDKGKSLGLDHRYRN